ncbi:hypothetical protein AGMMS50239_41410 [Bacteroidia bacterium]|nr:hypothetical protein AGMMS50239_41410 [Bacteroidia bacterium]
MDKQVYVFFFFKDPATTEIYKYWPTPSPHDALPQVTIGSLNPPRGGAILDLSQSGKKLGLALPAVHLNNDGDLQLEGGTKAEMEGTIVYNTNETLSGGKGLYVWTGQKWTAVSASTTTVTGTNGTYRIYTYPDGVGTWMIDNSKEGTPAATTYPGQSEGERGYYYTWGQAAGACPSGFHLPTTGEFDKLATYINSAVTADEKNHWFSGSANAGGYIPSTKTWSGWNTVGGWWCASSNQLYNQSLGKITGPLTYSDRYQAVRCVKDK